MSPDGTRVAAGAPDNDNSTGQDSGHVRVFRLDTGPDGFVQIGPDVDGEFQSDMSGNAVALTNGDLLAIGASRNDDPITNGGHVRVFQLASSTLPPSTGTMAPVPPSPAPNGGNTTPDEWIPVGEPILGMSPGGQLGSSVDISGDGSFVGVAVQRV